MNNPTDHTYTANTGDEETALTIDITYRYQPGDPPVLTVLEAIAQDPGYDGLPEYVKGAAQDWLDDEGYDMAKAHAERQRHGDYE